MTKKKFKTKGKKQVPVLPAQSQMNNHFNIFHCLPWTFFDVDVSLFL